MRRERMRGKPPKAVSLSAFVWLAEVIEDHENRIKKLEKKKP